MGKLDLISKSGLKCMNVHGTLIFPVIAARQCPGVRGASSVKNMQRKR